MRAAGASIKRIADELGTERKTVRRWLRLGHAPLWQQPSGDSILDPFVEFLTRRWNEGCRNAAQLWRELVQLGFRGRPSTVRHWLGKHHRHAPEQEGLPAGARPPVWPVPRGYRLARLLMADTATLSAEDKLLKIRLLEDAPALNAAIAWAQQFNALLRHKVAGDLDQLLAAADGTMLARFTTALRRDFDAINAALKFPWTTSPVEGQISRLKMLKRTMYRPSRLQAAARQGAPRSLMIKQHAKCGRTGTLLRGREEAKPLGPLLAASAAGEPSARGIVTGRPRRRFRRLGARAQSPAPQGRATA